MQLLKPALPILFAIIGIAAVTASTVNAWSPDCRCLISLEEWELELKEVTVNGEPAEDLQTYERVGFTIEEYKVSGVVKYKIRATETGDVNQIFFESARVSSELKSEADDE